MPNNESSPMPNHNLPKAFTTLTLDLGTATGWSCLVGEEIRDSGTELLASEAELLQQRKEGKERTGDIRFDRLLDFLEAKALACGADRLVIEDVIFASTTDQAQLWASLRTAVWVVARKLKLEVRCVPVKTLKLFAAGDGGADKSMMALSLAAAAPENYVPDIVTGGVQCHGRTLDSNEVDAIWLARYTTAADRGEVDFLSVYGRKLERRKEERARRAAVKTAIKAAGKCCGVYRKPAPFGRAICPKCGRAIRVPKASPSGDVNTAATQLPGS